jgi:hypothetical protein
MPHFMKIILRNQPLFHIEPNMGSVEVPDPHHAGPDSKKQNRVQPRRIAEEFVLVLPRGN